MIKLIDYGLGNIQAFTNTFKRLGISATTATNAEELLDASKLILPGVGSFDHAMQSLNDSGMRHALDDLVLKKMTPVLGICVGMQMLASRSDEGNLAGLGWIPGQVRSFSSSLGSRGLALPHMGWNDVKPAKKGSLFKGLEDDARFYFLHSFYFDCIDPSHVSATSEYGLNFHAAISAGHVHGVQFHPEKSHHWGSQLLKNFAEL